MFLIVGCVSTAHFPFELPEEVKSYHLKIPRNHPVTVAKANLGQRLFFDPRLSGNQSVSCGTCHQPDKAFTDGRRTAKGVGGVLDRNTPTLINRVMSTAQLWDMSAKSLEQQIERVILNKKEMDGDFSSIEKRLKEDEYYLKDFREVFKAEPSRQNIIAALASYVRSLVHTEAPYDRYVRGDKTALTPQQIRGKDLFFNKFKCQECHSGPNFTNEKLSLRCYPEVPGLPKERLNEGLRFKTPTLRNLTLTGPYFHNGRLTTIRETVEFYNLSNSETQVIQLEDDEIDDIVEFLKSLTSYQI